MRRRRASRTPLARALVVAATLAAALVAAVVAVGPVAAQDTTRLAPIPRGEEGWNDARALELVQRARERRRRPLADSALRSYRADVTGHIYFFIDREDEPEPVLLRADQVALELYWAEPDRIKQVIRGMRSEEQFPLRDFRYYLDRYTVIQNGFDDVIRVGEGRDVRNVIHPLAREGRGWYDFRLGDSTIIRLPGEPEPIRVYEVQVRPRSFDVPAIVGSLFLERQHGDLVRLAFTFTPAAYLDRRNERVEVLLENALWEGRYWLPREQRLLVRREIPEIDLDVGTVIRAALRVHDYELNVDLPNALFRGSEIVLAAGPEALADYDFEDGLFDGFDDVGLEGAEPGTLDAVEVEAIAGRILRERFLRGVPRVRFFAPTVSDVVRFDRSEGLVTGGGAAFGIGRSQAYAYAGWAWGSEEPLARIGWRPAGPDAAPRLFAEAFANRPERLGLRPATSGLLSSLSAALVGRDYRDIVPASGIEVGRRWGESGDRYGLSLSLRAVDAPEQARTTAPFDDQRAFRPVPLATEAAELIGAWNGDRRLRAGPVALSLRPRIELGLVRLDDEPMTGDRTRTLLRAHLDSDAGWTDDRRRTGLEGRLTAAFSAGGTLPQHAWYIGGPGTLPGHPFHAYAGAGAAVLDITAWRDVVPRLVRLRAFAAAGWAGGEVEAGALAPMEPGPAPPEPALESWTPGPSGGLRSSIGMGVGLIDGIVRLDYALETDDWDGVLILSVDPDFWSFL